MPISSGKTILYGSRGPFSVALLKGLLANGIQISHIFCAGVGPSPQYEGDLPVTQPAPDETLDSLATRHQIPLSYVSQVSDLLLIDKSHMNAPDYLLVACFPYRIPEAVRNYPHKASLNLHPSLLPHYRGPDPIFWQLRKGEGKTGVSIHMLTRQFDAGPIVLQKPVMYKEGSYKKEIEEILGQAGAELFTTLLLKLIPLENDSQLPQISRLSKAQDEMESSYYPMPSAIDYQISTEWSAQRAFNFIRGTWPPLDQFSITIENKTWIINQAIEYSTENKMDEKIRAKDDVLYIQFSPGILQAYGHKS